jgi:predicted permease
LLVEGLTSTWRNLGQRWITIAARLAEAYPEANRDWQSQVVSLRELRTRSSKPALLLSLAGAAVLLLIACANIGTVQLVWMVHRQQEIAMRFVLGATRKSVIGLLLVEALLLSVAGAASGLIVMFWGVRFLIRSGLLPLGFTPDITIDLRVLAFTLFVSLSATFLFTLAPLRHALAVRPGSIAADESRTSTSGNPVRQVHSWLVGAELSLVFVLLITALLLKTSVNNVLRVDLGFDPKGVLTGRVAYFHDENRIEFFRRIVDRVRALPDVQDIATAYSLPLDKDGAYFRPAIITARNRVAANQEVVASYHIVSAGYFRLLRMSIMQGRDFAETDGLQSPSVAIANQSLTRRIFPNGHAVGQQIACCEEGKTRMIVGVVNDLKSEGPESPAGPEIYVPFAQDSQVSTRVLIRASGDTKRLIPEVRAAIASVDPEWPLYDVRTMVEIYDSAIGSRRSHLIVIGSFAFISLALSVVGIYGTFTYVAANRSREFAIRMALGASQESILQLVLRDAGILVAAGLAVGIALALIAGHLIRALLFGVAAFDVGLYFEAIALLAATALICSLIPAMGAARRDPALQLRDL